MDGREIKAKIEKIRGELIGKTATIEMFLSKVLAIYIAKEDKTHYVMYMLNRIDMSGKILMYEQALKDKDPIISKRTYQGLLKDIRKYQDIRNLFAHSSADYKSMKDYTNLNKITFRNFKKIDEDSILKEAGSYFIKEHSENMKRMDKIIYTLGAIMVKQANMSIDDL